MPRRNHVWERASGVPFAPGKRLVGRKGALTRRPSQNRQPPCPDLLGLPFPLLSWSETFGALDAAARARSGSRTVSFVTFAGLCRAVIDPVARAKLSARILLPASRSVAFMLSRVARRPVEKFEPAVVLSSLLTYMDRRRRILLVGPDSWRLEATRRFIRAHTPWHDVAVVESVSPTGWHPVTAMGRLVMRGGADLLLVDGAGYAAESRVEDDPDLGHHGLVLLAGDLFTACALRQQADETPANRHR